MQTSAVTLEDLRALIAKTDALAHATADLFDDVVRIDDVKDRRSLERLAHLNRIAWLVDHRNRARWLEINLGVDWNVPKVETRAASRSSVLR